MKLFGKGKAEMKIRVYRANTGKWKNLGIVASTDRFWKIKKVIKKMMNLRKEAI